VLSQNTADGSSSLVPPLDSNCCDQPPQPHGLPVLVGARQRIVADLQCLTRAFNELTGLEDAPFKSGASTESINVRPTRRGTGAK